MAIRNWTAEREGPVRLHFSSKGHYKITVTARPEITRATAVIEMPDDKADQLSIEDGSPFDAVFRLPQVHGNTTIIGDGGSNVVVGNGTVVHQSIGTVYMDTAVIGYDGTRLAGTYVETDGPVYVNGRLMVPAGDSPEPVRSGPRTITVTVTVPAGSSIASRAAGGDFRAETMGGARFADVDAATSQGDIYAGTVDDLVATTSQGDITAMIVNAMGILTSSQGSVTVGLWAGSGQAKSSQGNITVHKLTGKRVHLTTSMGNITAHGAGDGSATCTTSMGNVQITKEAGSTFVANGRTSMGSVHNQAAV